MKYLLRRVTHAEKILPFYADSERLSAYFWICFLCNTKSLLSIDVNTKNVIKMDYFA